MGALLEPTYDELLGRHPSAPPRGSARASAEQRQTAYAAAVLSSAKGPIGVGHQGGEGEGSLSQAEDVCDGRRPELV